jgi:periplasmic divalent cation tolerance protein
MIENKMTQLIWVYTATCSQREAEAIAAAAVEEHLAAAAHVMGPIHSIYRWQGRVEKAEEWYCACKTIRGAYAELEQTIQRLHSYDLPAIWIVPITAADRPYLEWVKEQVEQKEGEPTNDAL